MKATPEEVRVIEDKARVQKKRRDRTLMIFLLGMGIIIVGIFVWAFASSSDATFTYRGVPFEKVQEIAPYRTPLTIVKADPTTGAAVQIPSYVYIRNDPRELDAIPFEGKLELMKVAVVNSSGDFNCGGLGIVGITELARLYDALGVDVVTDPEAGCDEEGRYLFLELVEGEKTKIVQFGPQCYRMEIANCEALQATERFLVESLVQVHEHRG